MTGKLKKLILELTGSDLTLLQQIHHGLNETPLDDFFQILNLDEALAFEAGSWVIRNEKSKEFYLLSRIHSATGLYGVFNYILFSRLEKERLNQARRSASMPRDLVHLNQELTLKFNNQQCPLAQRLLTVPIEAETQLVSRLAHPTMHYAREYSKREGVDTVIPFSTPINPSRELLVEKYAGSIAGSIDNYLRSYQKERKNMILL